MKKICIIGAGWYGCHLGIKLKKKGYQVTIFEKNKKIFLGSSGFNQFRLHCGFHYPRSDSTIKEIKRNFLKLKKEYKNFIFFPKKNIYCIANKKSLIDFNTYLNILRSQKLRFKKIKANFLQNIEGAINCGEGVFLNEKIIPFYNKQLKENIIFNTKVEDINKLVKNYDLVLDCTNNTLKNNFTNKFKFLLTISLIYKSKLKNERCPITIMDGDLPSLYPYEINKNTFTLTHSKYTHIKKFKSFRSLNIFKRKLKKSQISNIKKLMENDFSNYYKNFKKKFSYKGFFLSYKVIPFEVSDKRPLYIYKKNNFVTIFSAKIGNIYSAEDYVLHLLNKK